MTISMNNKVLLKLSLCPLNIGLGTTILRCEYGNLQNILLIEDCIYFLKYSLLWSFSL